MDTSIERAPAPALFEHEFAELCAKTNFSFLEGASRPEEMIGSAHELGLFAIAVADRNGLYGSVRAHLAARKLGQRYIVGAEIPVRGSPETRSAAAPIQLLAQDHTGYQNLCRLLSRAHEGRPREEAELLLAELAAHAKGLVAIDAGGAREHDEPFVKERYGCLRDVFADRAFVATWRNFDGEERTREARACALSTHFGIPLIATARPLFHHPSRKPVADVLQCIREKTTLDGAGLGLAPNAEAYLRSAAQMARLFHDQPQRLRLTVAIAQTCKFSLDTLHYSFPSDELAPGETPDHALRRFVDEGVRARFGDTTPLGLLEQIEKELRLIAKLGVAQFFLSVREIVNIAREKRILCQGRGSAANSAVCYVLGITAVDPSRSNLLFERFLSVERNEPPDIDVDFEHERREEVIQAIYEKYGRGRAAMVSEVTSYRGKSALRETAKVFGLSLEQVDRLAALVGSYDSVEVRDERLREAGFDPNDHRLGLVLRIARELQGFPRHMSTHVGGFVLSARPLDEITPVEPAKMPGRTVVPWDKDDIEALGFFKVDVLGLGMLTAIRKALALAHETKRLTIPWDPIEALANIPAEDERVYDAVCQADTVGVFQIESRAQMAMLPRLLPRCFYDLVIEVAIVRPGPIQGGMVHPYLRRRRKEEPATVPHPVLATILARTLGVPLFQEQVMQIAIEGAGYTGGEADELRRDMAAWKKNGRLLRHHDKLLRGFCARGISAEFGERLFSQIKGFGEYGFPESHAASFALLVYASAWLKVHHPTEFACALLNSQPMGFYSPSSIVRDAQRHGVTVFSADVGKSTWDSRLEMGPPLALRLGLRLVKGIGEEVANRIAEARKVSPFRDIDDLAHRAALRPDLLEALAEAGALSSLLPPRRQAMWKAKNPKFGELFEGKSSNEADVDLAPMPALLQMKLDYERTGLSVSDHPMCHLRKTLQKRRVHTSESIARLPHGTRVQTAGLVLTRQRPMTASGVVFITLEDETGVINLVLMPDVFERYYLVARQARLLLVHGKIERDPREVLPGVTPVIHVKVAKLTTLDLAGGIEARSRDFH